MSVQLSHSELVYLHDKAKTLIREGEPWGMAALSSTLLLSEARVYCEDYQQDEAHVALDKHEVQLLIHTAQRGDKDTDGRPVGARVLDKLERERLVIENGHVLTTAEGEDYTYQRAKEMRDADGSSDDASGASAPA